MNDCPKTFKESLLIYIFNRKHALAFCWCFIIIKNILRIINLSHLNTIFIHLDHSLTGLFIVSRNRELLLVHTTISKIAKTTNALLLILMVGCLCSNLNRLFWGVPINENMLLFKLALQEFLKFLIGLQIGFDVRWFIKVNMIPTLHFLNYLYDFFFCIGLLIFIWLGASKI